ncbi:phage tail tape measure protein [Streptomyces sp. NPDC094438]|uniref:phage tail tape measure protein n=1 Tax=Streptomyces sp. NPDC094438 TaxID=3366061 RepID=UPI003801346B
MARPITITLLGDLSDLSASLGDGTRDVNSFADQVENALREATREAGRLGDGFEESGRDVTAFADRAEGALSQAAQGAGQLGDEVAKSADEAGSKLGGFAKKIGLAAVGIGAAVGGALALGLKEAMDREAGTDLLSAQLGASPEQAKALGQAAGKVYSAGYGESIADANEALKGLWQQGLVPAGATADELADISKRAMDVAAVLGDDVGPTANAVGTMLKTGMAKNAKEAFDILVVGAQNGSNKAEDLLDTFNEYSVQFQRVGLDGKTAMGLISQALQAGARDSDQVADAIGQFGEKAVAGGTAVEDAFKSIGLNADDIAARMGKGGQSAETALGMTLKALRGTTDETVKLNAAAALFGDPANVMGKALYAMDPATAAASNGLDKVSGAAARAGATMHDNASQKLTAFWRTLETGAVDLIGGKVLPKLEDLATKFAPVGRAAKEFILDKAVPAAQALGEKVAPLAGVTKTVLLDNVVPAVQATGKAFADAIGFVEEHKGTFQVVAGIITVVLLPALITWGVQSVISAGLAVGAWISSGAAATGSAAVHVAASWLVVGGWLKAGAQAVISGAIIVGQWIAGAGAAILNGAVMVGQWVLMGTQSMIQAARMAAAWLLAMGPVPLIIAAIVGLALLIWQNWDKIKQWTGEAFQWVWDKIKSVFDWLVNLFLNFTGPGLLIKHWDTIKQKTAEAFVWVADKARQGLDAVVGFFRDLPGRILGFVGSMGSAALRVGSELISKLGEGLSRLSSFGQDIGAAVWRAVKNSINSLIDLLNWAIPDRIGIGPIGVDLPKNPIPKIRAMGGPASGLTRVGERGPEWVSLPGGSSVVPNHAAPAGGGVVVNVASNADPFAIGREVAWSLRVAGAR